MEQKEFEFDNEDWEELIKNTNELDIIVSEKQLDYILAYIGDETDEDGFIRDSKTKLRELSKDEDEIRVKEVGGILTGSKVFIKPNIASFSQHLIDKKINHND